MLSAQDDNNANRHLLPDADQVNRYKEGVVGFGLAWRRRLSMDLGETLDRTSMAEGRQVYSTIHSPFVGS